MVAEGAAEPEEVVLPLLLLLEMTELNTEEVAVALAEDA